jgi:hypothetical protein
MKLQKIIIIIIIASFFLTITTPAMFTTSVPWLDTGSNLHPHGSSLSCEHVVGQIRALYIIFWIGRFFENILTASQGPN